jgi:hypothetical protein
MVLVFYSNIIDLPLSMHMCFYWLTDKSDLLFLTLYLFSSTHYHTLCSTLRHV